MKYTWLVEKYLEGELSGEALHKFELEILRTPEVAEEVERVRSMNHFIQEQHQKLHDSIGLIEDYEDSENVIDEEVIRQDLESLKVRKISAKQKDVNDIRAKLTESRISHALTNQQSNKVLVRKVSVWLAAASVAILLATSSLLLIGKKGPVDYMAVYEQYYSAPLADISERSSTLGTNSTYAMALREYNQASYEIAYQLFDDIPEEFVHNNYYFLYKGITAMELGDFQAAIELFDHLMTDPVRKHKAMWYAGLSYLGLEDARAARSVFKDIVKTDGHFKKQARMLLRSI
jgi:tetratricopeptide (TPR) repeat protein